MVTGVAAFSPAGVTVEAFHAALLAGTPLHAAIQTFSTRDTTSTQGAELRDFDPAAFIPPMKLRRMDDVSRLAVAGTRRALDAAGWPESESGYERLGVILGTCTCGVHSTGEFLDRLQELGPTGAPALLFSNTVGNAAAGLVGLEHRLRGPNTTVSYKEASGLAAMAMASDLLRAGKADALVTGGAEDIYDLYYQVHDWFGVLSRAGEHPEGARPFDVTRNGFVMGEGAYLAVFETEDAAVARGAQAVARIAGTAAAGTATAVNAWPTDPDPLAWCMREALRDANLAPEDIGAVYASANGTQVLDAVEALALADVFGAGGVPVTSIKAITGEGGMAGAAGVVAAVLCGADGVIPPVAGLHEPDPALPSLDLVRDAPRSLTSPFVMVNGFASGGTLYSLVLSADQSPQPAR